MSPHDTFPPLPDAPMRTALRCALLAWYRSAARDLPWRRSSDPYAIWLSEIMLQQTRVETVVPYYHRWLAALPTVEALAAADEDTVLKLWEGLGYYRRARNLHRAARQVVADGGQLPRTAAAWQELPGIGRYTAGAIASITTDERVAVLDGNVKRVLSRLFVITAPIEERATEKALWARAEALVPSTSAGDFNQAMMELGARICLPRQPRCARCPLVSHCRGHATGQAADLPVRRPKAALPHRVAVAAAVCQRGRYLFRKRPSEGLLGGLWDFPGGLAATGEIHKVALTRTLREVLGSTVEIALEAEDPIAVVEHAYTHFRVTIHLYPCRIVAGGPKTGRPTNLRWLPRKRLDDYPLPITARRLLAALS